VIGPQIRCVECGAGAVREGLSGSEEEDLVVTSHCCGITRSRCRTLVMRCVGSFRGRGKPCEISTVELEARGAAISPC